MHQPINNKTQHTIAQHTNVINPRVFVGGGGFRTVNASSASNVRAKSSDITWNKQQHTNTAVEHTQQQIQLLFSGQGTRVKASAERPGQPRVVPVALGG
eukprot:9447572-Alexandrium_andersonii.AAC.1